MEIITSRQNPQIKAVCALSEKKGRKRAGLFRFDGIKLFSDCLGRADIQCVFVRVPVSDAVEVRLRTAAEAGYITEDKIIYVSEEVFEKLTDESSPEGIVTVAGLMEGLHERVSDMDLSVHSLRGKRILLAESLRDPGNLGTVMRSCAALGIDCLILSDDCADLYNPKTVRGAMGALFRMPTLSVETARLPEYVEKLRADGRRVYAAALRDDALKIGSFSLCAGDCFVIGNEGHGLSESLIDACTDSAIIPMREGNESLNAAAAAAVCIWETVRAEDLA